MADLLGLQFIGEKQLIGGGVIYEALVAGKPLLMHSIEHEEPMRSKNLYPIYNANTPKQIANCLQKYVDGPDRGRKMGIVGQKWYQGNVLAQAIDKYTDYFEQRSKKLGRFAR